MEHLTLEHNKLSPLLITPQHVSNLHALADGLLNEVLPHDMQFSMQTYCEKTNCGTVACSLGLGPYFVLSKRIRESWNEYSTRVFGIEGDFWFWCFGGTWTVIDNTQHGAGKRIKYMLARGVPGEFRMGFSSEHRLKALVPHYMEFLE
jgi:hypothetical protein